MINDNVYLDLVDEFAKNIEENSSIRKKEINNILLLVGLEDDLDYKIRKNIVRLGIPTLYSHYEGFLKKNFNLMILFLSELELSFDDINNIFVIYHILNMIDDNIKSDYTKTAKLLELFDKIRTDYSNNFFKPIINSKEKKIRWNLDHRQIDVIFRLLDISNKELLHIINQNDHIRTQISRLNNLELNLENNFELNIQELEYFIIFCNNNLKELYFKRNTIAHGDLTEEKNGIYCLRNDNIIVFEKSIEEFKDYCKFIILLLDLLSIIFIEYLTNKKFLYNNEDIIL